MAAVFKLDSNSVGLRYAKESSIGVLPGSPVWYPLEPNSFDDFGPEITTVARQPISEARQRKKGVTTDLEASGGFETDFTQTNLADLMQGFLFSAFETKTELASTAISATHTYGVASGGTGFKAGDLLFAKGFDTDGNNGLKTVASSTGTTVVVSETLVNETGQEGTISRVGFQFGSADAEIDVTGDVVSLLATVKDLTELGLSAGEWVYIGGDQTAEKFATAANNGWARVKSVAAGAIVFDKTAGTMVTDAGTGKTIRIFVGRSVRNASTRSTYQLERTLGAPDDAQPTQIQSEYLVGACPNELEISIPTADKIVATASFVATDGETRSGVTGVKSGDRPAIEEASAFNTSSDVVRIKLAPVDPTDTNPTAAFTYASEITVNFNNNVDYAKAVGVLGAIDSIAGTFEADVSMTAYFTDIASIAYVRNNTDLTLDFVLAKENAGIVFDFPLVTAGNGRVTAELDAPLFIPLDLQAASGAKVSADLDHTVLVGFYDYLPNAAMPA